MKSDWTLYFYTLMYLISFVSLFDMTSSRLASKTLSGKEIKPFPYLSHEKRGGQRKSTGIPIPYIKFHRQLNETKEVTLFDKVELVCEIFSFPPATVRWLKNGEDFASMQEQSPYFEPMAEREIATYLALIKTWGRNIYSLNIGSTSSKLTIECLGPEDVGEYTCVAETKYQQQKSKTIVTLPKKTTEFPEDVGNYYCNEGIFHKEPTVFSRTASVFEIQGQDLLLICRYSNGEEQETNWFGPESELIPKNSDKYKILDNGDLVIRDLTWKDMGSYKCVKQTASRRVEGDTFVYPVKPQEMTSKGETNF